LWVFTASLSYNTDDAFLTLNTALSQVSGLNGNEQNVANALSNYFNNGGSLPPNFLTVFGLTGGNLTTALSKLDGKAATDAGKGAFQLMTGFLDLMLDPWAGSRGGGGDGNSASGFAPEEQASFPPDIALAYASALKKPPPQPRPSISAGAPGARRSAAAV
jgi:hypothetical protein